MPFIEADRPRWCCLCSWVQNRRRHQFWARATDEQLALRDRFREIHSAPGTAFFFVFPPRHVGEFLDLNRAIGEGAYGTVFRGVATDKGLETVPSLERGKTYAVKRISIPKRGFAEEIARSFLKVSAERHVEFTKALGDPGTGQHNMVHMCAMFAEVGKSVYQVMEILEGPDLFDFLARRRTTVAERDAAGLARQIFTAVHYLHRSIGALHRDIKPENFGFTRPVAPGGALPELKLFDLGLAWVLPAPVTEQTAGELLPLPRCGTQLYMAPEVWQWKSGPPSDVWGAGLIVFLLLSLELPFRLMRCRTSLRAVQQNVLTFEGSCWLQASELAMRFVRSVLEKDPARRATTSMALADPWLRVPGQAAEVARTGPSGMPARSKVTESRVWQTVLCAQEEQMAMDARSP